MSGVQTCHVIQMCTVDDLTGGEPCLRVAQWTWRPSPADHPVHLCNYHAGPLIGPAPHPDSLTDPALD